MQMTARCSPAGGLAEMALPGPPPGGDVIPGRAKAEVKLPEVRPPPPPARLMRRSNWVSWIQDESPPQHPQLDYL